MSNRLHLTTLKGQVTITARNGEIVLTVWEDKKTGFPVVDISCKCPESSYPIVTVVDKNGRDEAQLYNQNNQQMYLTFMHTGV